MNLDTIYKNKAGHSTQRDIINIKPHKSTLLCFSHLRWNFVYQRPQHLMSRFAAKYMILFIEEPVYVDEAHPYLIVHEEKSNILILTPHISKAINKEQEHIVLTSLLKDFLLRNNHHISIKWYLTPMMLPWTVNIPSDTIIYDCMDELSAFKNAPPDLKELEQRLLLLSDMVFTGGASLYKVKSLYHKNVYLFPSSVDTNHFLKARNPLPVPDDQKFILRPVIGFYGVIDERLDIKLLKKLALHRPDWSFVIIGPVVKIDINALPQLPNIYYLGKKTYEELPYYLSGWDVAFLPFAINESTKFISPTKTPEYLAAGLPVVSTPIIDVIATYQYLKTVHIANPADLLAFVNAIELALNDSKDKQKIYMEADSILQHMSWDKTFSSMHNLILEKPQKEAV